MVKGPPVLEDVVEFVNSMQEGLSDTAWYMYRDISYKETTEQAQGNILFLLSLIFLGSNPYLWLRRRKKSSICDLIDGIQ
jgi:hypothetical protein